MNLMLMLLCSACAAPSTSSSLPRIEELELPTRGLVPPNYLSLGKGMRRPDPQLVEEIQTFLTKNLMLTGLQDRTAADLPLVLNGPVTRFLHTFTHSKKEEFQTYLSRSRRYLPMIRRIFQEYGLPQDLVYIALVESGFNPAAKSPAEAVGIWQFIEGTARRYGLKINNQVDERRDPEKSTRAAARYLLDLYRQFSNWYLAAAGYNAGENRIEAVTRKYCTMDFWTMAQKKLLPQETCNFVPQLIAATIIANAPEKYGFSGSREEGSVTYEIGKDIQ
jgi:membrane-bound lytic murein transglycosylase D